MTNGSQPTTDQHVRGAAFGLMAAALFGLSAPLAKLLLGSTSPVLLAGLLYLGAAIGLWFQRVIGRTTSEARLQRSDVPKLIGVVAAGGVEAPFTVLLAVTLFGEHLGRYAAGAVVFVLIGAATLGLEPGALGADAIGVLMLAAACFCWALDNNLTQRLSVRDPFAIVRVKTLIAGLVNVALGLIVVGGPLPSRASIAGALVLGSMSYGASIVLDTYA